MCLAAQTEQEQPRPEGRERDVDDLIFPDQREWLISDR